MRITAAAVTLRAVGPGDEPFLRRLYATIREPEFAPMGLEPEALQSLLTMQFDARERLYRETYPDAAFDLVAIDGVAAGRLSVDRTADRIHVVDIALLPESRGRGVGTRLLEGLLKEGRASARAVTLNALRESAALGLYERLGFTVTRQDEVYIDLEYRPDELS